eukprot:1158192-Pelagomonas_calceolata.AAC.6
MGIRRVTGNTWLHNLAVRSGHEVCTQPTRPAATKRGLHENPEQVIYNMLQLHLTYETGNWETSAAMLWSIQCPTAWREIPRKNDPTKAIRSVSSSCGSVLRSKQARGPTFCGNMPSRILTSLSPAALDMLHTWIQLPVSCSSAPPEPAAAFLQARA